MRAAGLALAFLALPARANFVVSGQFLYVDREFTFDGGYTGIEPNLPVRFADVYVVNASNQSVLAQGFTDATGNFSIAVTGAGTASVQVRCFSTSLLVGGKPVRVETTGGAAYSTSSPIFPNWNLSTNLSVGALLAPKVFSGAQQGNPFNLLDMGLRALEYVEGPSLGAPPPALIVTLRWPGGSGSFTSATTVTMAVDDGYDDAVALHEVGHVLHFLYSDSDSPGGAHSFSQSNQDPRLSFGEGWATFFAGAVRKSYGEPDPGFYMDANNDGSTGPGTIQLRMRFENGFPYDLSTGGEADEGAVFCALWDVIDDAATPDPFAGDDDPFDGTLGIGGGATVEGAQWSVFVGPVAAAPNLTIADWWNGWFAPTDFGDAAELAAVFAGWKMRFANDAVEPNGSLAAASSITPGPNFWSPVRTLYFSAASPPAPGTGDQDHYRFFVPGGATIEVETRYPGANPDAETFCDPALTLYSPAGAVLASAERGGTDRNARIAGATAAADGYYAARVHTNSAVRPYGSYEVRVLLGQVATAPILTAAAPTLSVSGGGSVALSLSAGLAQSGLPYLVLASASGDFPGAVAPGGALVPLNPDLVTILALSEPNASVFSGFLGNLSIVGTTVATVVLPPGVGPSVVGAQLTFAALVFSPGFASVQRVSSAATVEIVP
ncbi:MAG TPA: hypothetical protein VFI25_20320 [Planctomycetota bacterium]|jgi:hypothetical protein|nr:hypothetical protein [Planctomycetota bacterium]